MRRLIAVLTVALMFTGCGGGGGSDSSANNAATPNQTATSTETATPTETPPPTNPGTSTTTGNDTTGTGTTTTTPQPAPQPATPTEIQPTPAPQPTEPAPTQPAPTQPTEPVQTPTNSGSVDTPVEKKLVSIKVVPADNVLAVGLQKQFTATGTYSDGEVKDLTAVVTWNSSDPSVATVSNDDGSKGVVNVLATSAQRIVVTATLDAIKGTTNLTVPVIELVTIAVTPANPTLAVGLMEQFVVTGTYSDGTTADDTARVFWSSSDPSVVSINGQGTATALKTSTQPIIITATLGTVTNTTTVTVF